MSVVTIEEHTLLPRPLNASSVVLDLGANAGRFSRAMVARFGCACHAVEANPAMADRIPDDPRIHIHRHAMGGEPGEARFHISSDPLGSGFEKAADLDYTDAITVRVETLPRLIRQLGLDGIDLLKADIEGAEIAMLDACSDDDLRCVDQFTIEFHDFNDVTPRPVVDRVLDRFRDLGYSVYSKARHSHCDVLILDAERLGVSAIEWAWIRTGRHYLTGAARLARKAIRPATATA